MFKPTKPNLFIGETQRNVANYLLEEGVPQTLLFFGPSGVGKTSLAEFAAVILEGENPNYTHFNCVDQSSINIVRSTVKGLLNTRSLFSENRILFLDEIHGWSGKAQEALLTDLENLPEGVYVFAASTQPHKVTDTLKSRFKTFKLPIPTEEEQKVFMLKYFNMKTGKEIDVRANVDLLTKIYQISDGNMRSLVKNMDIFISQYEAGKSSYTFATGGGEVDTTTKWVWDNLLDGQWGKIFSLPKNTDFESINRQLPYIAIISLNRSGFSPLAEAVVLYFGEPLGGMDPKVTFYNRILKVKDAT